MEPQKLVKLCELCKGTGRVIASDLDAKCPDCDGRGNESVEIEKIVEELVSKIRLNE